MTTAKKISKTSKQVAWLLLYSLDMYAILFLIESLMLGRCSTKFDSSATDCLFKGHVENFKKESGAVCPMLRIPRPRSPHPLSDQSRLAQPGNDIQRHFFRAEHHLSQQGKVHAEQIGPPAKIVASGWVVCQEVLKSEAHGGMP